MFKVISGHTKYVNKKALKVLSFHMLSAWVKHQIVRCFLEAKISAVCTEFSMCLKFHFSQWKNTFSNSLINLQI